MEENTNYLDQLLDLGYAEKTTKILSDKAEVTLRTLTSENQLELESTMTNVTGAPAFVVHTWSIKMLAYTLKSFKTSKENKVFKTVTESEEFLKKSASVIIDSILAAYNKFNQEITALTTPENVDKNFSMTPQVDSELK